MTCSGAWTYPKMSSMAVLKLGNLANINLRAPKHPVWSSRAAHRPLRFCVSAASRRELFLSTVPLLMSTSNAEGAVTTATEAPLADLPMRRLKLPKGALGRDYVLVQLMIKGKGPYDFMVDSGLTAEMITPHLRESVGIRKSLGKLTQGLGAGGAVSSGELVELEGAALCCGRFAQPGAMELPLPPLTAVVTNFPQEHLDPDHDPVEGMLGMELLQYFDTDLDFKSSRLRLWAPGSGSAAAVADGLVELPAAVLNETGVLGIRATTTTAAVPQPFVGIVDCGASFSALNWEAARLGGLPPRDDTSYVNSAKVYSLGVDGRPLAYPSASVQFTFTGDPIKTSGSQVSFTAPPSRWKPWDKVTAAVGDLPIFEQLLGDGRRPFRGPAALIGLDVWAQRRVVIGAGDGSQGRRRRLFVSPR